ncbi:hypothetical protein [Fontivita pretiosa]|uniref:hypothetical protein n=1 Tax=Fontivita pretiosa TaxID=2989684 RepID=UPI003D163FA9
MPQTPDNLAQQIVWLLILAIPVAAISRTVASEEVFREPREWCIHMSRTAQSLFARKFFYVFTCEYCFSHWVTLLLLIVTRFKLLMDDWRGYIISWFSLVFVANVYLNLYARLRVDITSEKKEIEAKEKQIEKIETELKEAGTSPR